MAEFLIKTIDAINSDPIKDTRGCYKQGDIVQIYPDGTCKEPPSNSKMVIIKVIGLSFEMAKKYMESEVENPNSENQKTIIRRKHKIRIDDIPLDIKQTLKKDRWISLDWSQIKSYVRNKITNLDEI